MQSREWHLDRIEELKFKRNNNLEQHNRYKNTLIALLSVIAVFFVFEISKQEKNILWVILLGVGIIVVIFVIDIKPNTKKEDDKIQRNYDAILGREN